MASMKLYGKDLSEYEDINVDELLKQLTPEQIEELGAELIDPDDSHIPASDRCRYRLDKAPTGPFNRKRLIQFLEKKAREEKDWDEEKPYSKETRGKVFVPKKEKVVLHEDESVETEWDEVLKLATEEELVDLAAILGFHGMLNQVQYHKAFVEQAESEEEEEDEDGNKKEKKSGFQGVAKHENFKLYDEEPPNATDVADSLKRLLDNDPKLTELNLNNIKTISLGELGKIAMAVKDNTHLENLHMANVQATDRVAKKLAQALEVNKTLKTLNMESNYITGQGIITLMEAINKNQSITELRLCNQKPQLLGVKAETKIAELLQDNHAIIKLGLFFDTCPNARVRATECIQRNNDEVRQLRVGESKGKEEAK